MEKIGCLINFLLLQNYKQPAMLAPALGELLTSPNDDQRILTLGSNYLLVNANMIV